MNTPKTLNEAIDNGLKDIIEFNSIKQHVRDYIAQKFTVVMAEVDPGEAAVFRRLFKEIVNEE